MTHSQFLALLAFPLYTKDPEISEFGSVVWNLNLFCFKCIFSKSLFIHFPKVGISVCIFTFLLKKKHWLCEMLLF